FALAAGEFDACNQVDGCDRLCQTMSRHLLRELALLEDGPEMLFAAIRALWSVENLHDLVSKEHLNIPGMALPGFQLLEDCLDLFTAHRAQKIEVDPHRRVG